MESGLPSSSLIGGGRTFLSPTRRNVLSINDPPGEDIMSDRNTLALADSMNLSTLSSLCLRVYPYFGILACAMVLGAMTVPALLYTGKAGERYSFLNHFVSELGEAGASRAAAVFNAGLISAGLLFVPFTIGLGVSISGVFSKLGMLVGIWTAISCMRVGMFSMDKLEPHVHAALAFFDGAWITMALFPLAIMLQPGGADALPCSIAWIGFACLPANLLFVFGNPRPRANARLTNYLVVDPLKARPRIWRMAIMEWVAVLSSILWYLSTALIVAFE
jgi:hypothetical protein